MNCVVRSSDSQARGSRLVHVLDRCRRGRQIFSIIRPIGNVVEPMEGLYALENFTIGDSGWFRFSGPGQKPSCWPVRAICEMNGPVFGPIKNEAMIYALASSKVSTHHQENDISLRRPASVTSCTCPARDLPWTTNVYPWGPILFIDIHSHNLDHAGPSQGAYRPPFVP